MLDVTVSPCAPSHSRAPTKAVKVCRVPLARAFVQLVQNLGAIANRLALPRDLHVVRKIARGTKAPAQRVTILDALAANLSPRNPEDQHPLQQSPWSSVRPFNM